MSKDENRWAAVPWPEEDRALMLAEVRAWLETWRRVAPCPKCGWPFQQGHYCGDETPL